MMRGLSEWMRTFQTPSEQLVKDTVNRMLENQARFIVGVQRGIEQSRPRRVRRAQRSA